MWVWLQKRRMSCVFPNVSVLSDESTACNALILPSDGVGNESLQLHCNVIDFLNKFGEDDLCFKMIQIRESTSKLI